MEKETKEDLTLALPIILFSGGILLTFLLLILLNYLSPNCYRDNLPKYCESCERMGP